MRKIEFIVLHCTATAQNTRISSIQNYWRNVMKWSRPGYHYIIEPNGRVTELAPITQVTNGVAGLNARSIHIAFIGGVDRNNKPVDNRTVAQINKMRDLINDLLDEFPKAKVMGHRDFPNVAKACPSFDAIKWFYNN
ncbi:MAG: hypothetical protein DDT31_01745 [Syntrophomonadaceae bacterium]|nr:hypothetical protein [Bacillota bacterium]